MTRESSNPTFYDADSTSYDAARWTSKGGAFTNRAQQSILAELCADWDERRIVEVGPGTARFTIPLARRGNRLTLVDLSPEMLEVARGNIEREGAGEAIEAYVEGSIYELPFEDASFDHAVSLNVFNHLERAGDALAELARVVRPGSTLLFNYANLQSYYWPVGRRINRSGQAVGQEVFSRWERPADVRRMIDEAGLDLVRRTGNVHMPRGMDRLPVLPAVRVLDAVSRRAPLSRLAPVHFCLCRKRERREP